MPEEPLTAPAEARLHRCHDVPVGVRVPFPLEERLNQLLQVAEDAGQRTDKTELVAAFLYASPSDVEGLESTLRSYRIASASDALLAPPADNVVRLQRRRPGPRRRKAAATGG
jgi:hypothetical protein